MKLALVVPGGVDRSGEYRIIPALLAVIAALSQSHEVHVFALLQEPLPGRWQTAGATVHNVGAGRTRMRAVYLIRAEHRRGAFRLIQSFWSGPCGQVAVVAARVLGVAAQVHVAGGELQSLPDIQYGGRLRWYGRLAEAAVLRLADRVTAASEPMIGTLAGLGIRATRLPLGIDQAAWPPRAPVARLANAQARLIHVASLNRVKDQATLLLALAGLAAAGVDFHADLVGDDTLDGSVQALGSRLGLAGRLQFHGFLTQRQLRPLFERADLLVMASRHEAGPIAVVEAAVLGVPTVGTAVGHIQEWAPHAALAVPVGDVPALTAAIQRLLADEDLRLQIAWRAHVLARDLDARSTARSLVADHAELAVT